MNHNSLIKSNLINMENIEHEKYTLSLISEAYNIGLISNAELSKFQTQLMQIVNKILTKFTKGESSSVHIEKAQNIFKSVSYCIDAYSISFNQPDVCLNNLISLGLHHFYNEGINLIHMYTKQAKELLNELKFNKLNTELYAYNSTLDTGFTDSFETYDEIFDAHNAVSNIDYPLVFDDMKMEGIIYIKNYLETLKIETDFCQFFGNEVIENLLFSYGKIHKIDYRDLLINIFEILLNNCIFSAMLRKNVFILSDDALIISNYEYITLNQKLLNLTADDLNFFVSVSFEYLSSALNAVNTCKIEANSKLLLKNYILDYKNLFISKLKVALKNNNLNKFLICIQPIETQMDHVFDQGSNLNDENFRLIYNKILECKNINEKIEIIVSNIHSLKDFLDILNSNCLFNQEFIALFNSLNYTELSLLTRIMFTDDLRAEKLNLLSYSYLESKKTDIEWQKYFIKFLCKLSIDRLQKIKDLINTIE